MGFASGFGIGAKPTLINFSGKTAIMAGDSVTAFRSPFTRFKSLSGLTTTYNRGTNGRRFCQYGGYSENTRLSHPTIYEAFETPTDFIILRYCINDCAFIDNAGSIRQNQVMGSQSDTTAVTVKGALYTFKAAMLARYPAAKLIVLTNAYGESTASDIYAGDSVFLADGVKTQCDYLGIPCFNLVTGGVLNADNYIAGTTSGDGLHPTNATYIAEEDIWIPWMLALTN